MKTLFYNRSFQLLTSQPDEVLTFSPKKYSYISQGGPERCTISATGTRADLWNMINLLGYPVEVYDDNGRCLWWGYLGQCEIKDEYTTARANLSKMANYVRVAYTTVNADGSIADRATTTAGQNTISQSAFGTKETLLSMSRATDAQAVALRDSYLAQAAKPTIDINQTGRNTSGLSAVYTCYGYWNYLSWRYYANAGTAVVATTSQLDAMLSAQTWVNDVIIRNASGIDTNQFRAGDNTVQAEAEQLLDAGTTNNRKLLAFVSQARVITIREEDAEPATPFYYQHPDGSLSNLYSEHQDIDIFQAGYWVDRSAIIPPEANTRNFSGRLAMIDKTEYDIDKKTISLTPRDVITIDDLTRAREG